MVIDDTSEARLAADTTETDERDTDEAEAGETEDGEEEPEGEEETTGGPGEIELEELASDGRDGASDDWSDGKDRADGEAKDDPDEEGKGCTGAQQARQAAYNGNMPLPPS